jgi:hypothetical protein
MRRILQPLVRLWRALLSSLDCGNFADCILRGFPCLDHDVIRSDLHASLAITDARTNCDDRDHSNESDQRDLELSRSICSQKRIVHRRSLTLVVCHVRRLTISVQRSATPTACGRPISSGLIECAIRFVWQHNHFCANVYAAIEIDHIVVQHADAAA